MTERKVIPYERGDILEPTNQDPYAPSLERLYVATIVGLDGRIRIAYQFGHTGSILLADPDFFKEKYEKDIEIGDLVHLLDFYPRQAPRKVVAVATGSEGETYVVTMDADGGLLVDTLHRVKLAGRDN